MERTARSAKFIQYMLLVGAGWLLVGMLLSGSASASDKGDQSGQEGQYLFVIGQTVANQPRSLGPRTVANRPMTLRGEPRKRCKDRVRANEPMSLETEPKRINLGYGVIRAGVAEGSIRSDMEATPPCRALGKRG